MSEPAVCIVMGSDSDLNVMNDARSVLEEFDIPCEVRVLSAHRTPEETLTWAKDLERRGVKAVIAGAGGAAHLAGVVAAHTVLPVIGVPIPTPHLGGVDSLYSTVQMPKGIPVATVAIGNARNAGILAVQIMGASHEEFRKKLWQFRDKMREKVLSKKV